MSDTWISDYSGETRYDWNDRFSGKDKNLDKAVSLIADKMQEFDNIRIEMIKGKKHTTDEWNAVSQILEGLEMSYFCITNVAKEI